MEKEMINLRVLLTKDQTRFLDEINSEAKSKRSGMLGLQRLTKDMAVRCLTECLKEVRDKLDLEGIATEEEFLKRIQKAFGIVADH